MEPIKHYDKVHPEDQLQGYAIKRMEDLYQKFAGHPDAPHRHEYYTILLVEQAEGEHRIDFNAYPLGQQQIFFVGPGQVHQIIEKAAPKGYVLTFSRAFLMQNGIEACFIEDLQLFHDAGESPPLQPSAAEWTMLHQLFQQMETFALGNEKFKDQGIGALLKLFLIRCNNSCTLPFEDNTQTTQASLLLLRNFKQILEDRYAEWHQVQQYAQAMHITADYLNASVKSLTGKSAKEHIQKRLLLAARRMLRFSDAPTKAIAYQLGFSEPANFSQFFKRLSGMSPSQFKESQD